MAKLRDQMTSGELLELILSGTMKNEIIKKHRTSDEELAMMLLPLYRNGDLSKEEFNDFFKGAPLTPRETESPEPTTRPASQEDLPPSEIVKSFATELQEEQDETEKQEEVQASEEALEMDFTPPSEEAEILEPIASGPSLDVDEQPLEEEAPVAVPSGGEGEESLPDSAAMSSVLDMIFAKLGSIDSRLAALEKKLSS